MRPDECRFRAAPLHPLGFGAFCPQKNCIHKNRICLIVTLPGEIECSLPNAVPPVYGGEIRSVMEMPASGMVPPWRLTRDHPSRDPEQLEGGSIDPLGLATSAEYEQAERWTHQRGPRFYGARSAAATCGSRSLLHQLDRKSVVWGKSVDLGGR